jgi:hypothetical protein
VPAIAVAAATVVRPVASNSVKTGTNKAKTGVKPKDVGQPEA